MEFWVTRKRSRKIRSYTHEILVLSQTPRARWMMMVQLQAGISRIGIIACGLHVFYVYICTVYIQTYHLPCFRFAAFACPHWRGVARPAAQKGNDGLSNTWHGSSMFSAFRRIQTWWFDGLTINFQDLQFVTSLKSLSDLRDLKDGHFEGPGI